MRLSVSFLHEKLSEQFPCVLHDECADNSATVNAAVLYRQGMSIRSGFIYITEYSDALLDGSDVPVIYCSGYQPRNPRGIWISTQAGAVDVLNAVTMIEDRYTSWEYRIKDTILAGGSLKDMLSLISSILDNPVFLLDTNFTVYEQYGEDRMPLPLQVFNEDRDNFNIITAIRQSNTFSVHFNETKSFFVSEQILPFKSLNTVLIRDSRPIGILMVAECFSTITESDREPLDLFARYISYLLEHEQYARQSMDGPGAVLFKMLSDMSSDYDTVIRSLQTYDWSEEDEYLCASFLTYSGKISADDTGRVCHRLRNEYPGSCAFPFEAGIVCYFNLTRTGKSREDFFNTMKIFIRDNYLRTGYSRIVTGINHLRRQYRQADFALKYGMKKNSFKWIFFFDDYVKNYLKLQIISSCPAELVVHPGLLALQQSDRESGTEYVPTLKALLECNMSATAAAAKLFIHRSTLLYRTDKIKTILESNLDDYDEQTYLALSFFLLEKD